MRLENRRRLLSMVVCAAPAAFIALCSGRLFAAASAEPPANKLSPKNLFPDTPPILGTPSDAGGKNKQGEAPGDAAAAGRDRVNRKKRASKAEKG